MFKNANVLIAGGTGMIGRYLIPILSDLGAKITVASIDKSPNLPPEINCVWADLTDKVTCSALCKGKDFVFNLAGVKGSPQKTKSSPASFLVPMLQFNTNLMEAALNQNVKRFLYTSSIGVYGPSKLFKEDDVWQTFPSPNDRFAGWAKRIGELQAEAYKIEYNRDFVTIVRPANVYGMYDTFEESKGAMVVPSLIRRVVAKENPLTLWGDGSPVRDLIYAKDVALGMVHLMSKELSGPFNLGSGCPVSIKELAQTVLDVSKESSTIVWDKTKPNGDQVRLMDISRAVEAGWTPKTTLRDGIKEVYDWYKAKSN